MKRASSIITLSLVAMLYAAIPAHGEDIAEAGADSTSSYWWGGVYTSRIELDEYTGGFPWNDPARRSYLTDRVSLMFDAQFANDFHFFIKGTTGLRGSDWDNVYSSRFFIDQGHLSATWQGKVTGKLFLRERVLRNRNSLIYLVSNDSGLARWRGEGFDVAVLTPGPLLLTYTGALFRDYREQKQNFGLPSLPLEGRFLNLFEGGIRRSSWHVGMTLADVRSTWAWQYFSALYGFDGGFRFLDGMVNLEFARTAREWEDFEDGLLGLDFDAMTWGNISAVFPDDGVLAAEWTGFALNGGDRGKFGLTPGYRYSGYRFRDHIGEVPSGYVESYIEAWWKHPRLASLVTLKAADRYSYRTQKGGGVLETSIWTRFTGGLETTARAFFAEGSRPVFIVSTVDDNSLTRLLMTARIDDTGGESEFSFLTEAGINLGRRLTLGGSVYLERSVSGFYSADIEARAGKRFVFRASVGTYMPGSTYADLNYDPSPARTWGDKTISFYTRIWLGGI